MREVRRLRKMAADLAGQAESLEQALAAAPAAIVAADYAIGQSPPPEVLADWVKAGKKAVDWGSLSGQDLPDVVLQGRKAEELLAEVIRVYSGFDRVRAIAVGQFSWEIRVYVLTEATEFYDGELIGSLIEAEYDLHRKFEPLCLSVDYAAVGCPGRSESGYCGASLIWRRGDEDGE